jgi:hypothetical protein
MILNGSFLFVNNTIYYYDVRFEQQFNYKAMNLHLFYVQV